MSRFIKTELKKISLWSVNVCLLFFLPVESVYNVEKIGKDQKDDLFIIWSVGEIFES